MECVSHTGEKVFMVCKSCDKFPFVCGVCIEEEHAEHKLQTLRNAAQSIRQNLEQVETENDQVFKEIKSDLDGLTAIREDLKQNANIVDDEIAKHVDVIRSKIDEVNKEVIQKHKVEVGKNTQVIEKTEKAMKQKVSQIDTFKMKVAKLQKMNDYVDVIKSGRDVEVPDTSRIPKPDIQALTFVPGTVKGGELERMFGGLHTSESSNNEEVMTTMCDESTSDFVGSIERESNTKITPVTSFKLPKTDGIASLVCSEPGLCWMKCQDKNSVKLSNISGQITQAVNLGTKTVGFTVTLDNKLLFCCTTQKCIKEMDLSDGEITEKFNTSPLTPNFICISPSGDIYVTMYDNSNYDILRQKSCRVVFRLITGKEAQCSKSVFVIPMEVCVNNSGTRVAVINSISLCRKELVILDKELSPIAVYRGPSVLTHNSLEYVINGAMFDARDNILIIEGYSKTVQLLSPSCELLKVLLTIDTSPWSLAMNGDGVWVGDGEGKIQVFKYTY